MNGVLVIDKPKGWTSHDVVARVRSLLGVRKAGHGGTLDPLATGVLVVYLGEGTKLVPFNLEGTKDYRAVMKLGQETDTLDADGKITAEKSGFSCTAEEVEGALKGFRGRIRQRPPLFSAIKQGGVPLYRRARAGEKPEVEEREAVIQGLSLKDFAFPLATLEITCGRGTYIRSLCADIGRSLGCGAHVVELRRLRSGRFSLEQAVTLEEIASRAERRSLGEKLVPLGKGAEFSEEVQLEAGAAEKVRQGQPLQLSDLPEKNRARLRKGQRMGLFQGPEGFLAIAEAQVDAAPGLPGDLRALRILRVFHR